MKIDTTKLLSYQIPAAEALLSSLQAHNGALDASDTGTGKTYTALATTIALGKPVFVVCPKSVIPSWKRAAAHFGIEITVCNYEKLRTGSHYAVERFEDGTFQWKSLDPARFVIIFDECHWLKNAQTSNCGLGLAAIRQRYAVLALSATAADNPVQMKFIGMLCRLFGREQDFPKWLRVMQCTKGRFGDELVFKGDKKTLEFVHKKIFPEHGYRIRIADLGDIFPETQITAECYDLNGEAGSINAVYAEMEKSLQELEAKEAADKKNRNTSKLTEILRARQRTEILKTPALTELASDAKEEGLSVALFVNFDATIDSLREKLQTECLIRGGQTAEEREEAIRGFQTDEEPIIICNASAGGVGIGLQGSKTSRRRQSIICPNYSAQGLRQLLGRVHRIGGAVSLQRIFLAAGTIEERICARVREKLDRLDTLNDGDLSIRENEPFKNIKL